MLPAKCTCSKCSVVLLICFSVRALKILRSQYCNGLKTPRVTSCVQLLVHGGIRKKTALQKFAGKPHLWPRYTDDIFMVWTYGEEKLDDFIKYLNNIHPTINFYQ